MGITLPTIGAPEASRLADRDTTSSSTRTSESTIFRAAQASCIIAVALFAALYMDMPAPNHDVWHQMALARESLKLGYIPTTDLYSYAQTVAPVVDHEWLAGVVALLLYRAAGLNGFMLLWVALTAALWAACAVGLRGTRTFVAICAAALMAPLIMYSQLQPGVAQAYSSLMTALIVLIVRADSSSPHRRWLLLCIPVSVLWVNLHAGAVVGVAVLSAHAIERRIMGRAWFAQAGIAAAAVAAFAASPFVIWYYPYLARALTMARPEISQWQPFWFFDFSISWSCPFIASLMILAWTIWRRRLFPGALITLALAALAARAHKNLPFYAIAWLVFVAREAPVPAIPKRIQLAAGIVAAFLIPFLSVRVYAGAFWNVVLPSVVLPVRAADYLERTGFRGNVMTFFRHGGYLSWRLYPNVKVSCDGRYEVAYFPQDVDRNFEAYLRRPDLFRQELARLPQTDLILIDRRMPARDAVSLLDGWHPVYEDEVFALLGRDTSTNR